MQNSEKIWQIVDGHRPEFEGLSDRIWGMPEIAYTEYRSVAEHTAMLKSQGFRVTENVADIPTAVMGEAGRRRAGHRHPRRIRRTARPQSGGRHRRTEARRAERPWSWLRT